MKSSASGIGLAALAVLAYALCDLAHELLGHGLATLLVPGLKAVMVSTVGLSTSASSPVVALGGPLVNLVLAMVVLPLASVLALPPVWRYLAWLFGSINAFNATAYLLYAALLGTGDWAVVFEALSGAFGWRPLAGVAGVLLYLLAVRFSLRSLHRLMAGGVLAPAQVPACCAIPYWAGGVLLTLGAVFNPFSPWYILTSGVASGFGAMLGLLLMPALAQRGGATAGTGEGSLHIGRGWWLAAALVGAVFVGVFGPGLAL